MTSSVGRPTSLVVVLSLGVIVLSHLLPQGVDAQRYLAVQAGQLRLNGEKVFLSGMNLAWYQFGMDFGGGRYDCCTGQTMEDYIRRIAAAGGNSIRTL